MYRKSSNLKFPRKFESICRIAEHWRNLNYGQLYPWILEYNIRTFVYIHMHLSSTEKNCGQYVVQSSVLPTGNNDLGCYMV